jgi:hypothetical protein
MKGGASRQALFCYEAHFQLQKWGKNSCIPPGRYLTCIRIVSRFVPLIQKDGGIGPDDVLATLFKTLANAGR